MPNCADPQLGHDAAAPRSTARKRLIARYCTATALAGGILSAIALAAPVAAQQGGEGGAGVFGIGGNGGDPGEPGHASTCVQSPASSTCQVAGGAAGAEPGGDGGDGSITLFGPGGGGGGGANGSLADPIGGNGGDGGDGGIGGQSNGGGGGGAGGIGLVLTTPFVNSGLVRGGDGGNGGAGGKGAVTTGDGGGGGDGGSGIFASGTAITNTVDGTISGGNGGAGGAGSPNGGLAGAGGAGGTGIAGSGITVVNAGSIAGGLGGDGVTRGYALHLFGGVNSLELADGGSLTGGIEIDVGASLTFDQPTDATLTNLISGPGGVTKAGAGTLTLDGDNVDIGAIAVAGGTLRLGHDNAAGGADNSITTTGSVISYADGVDIATPIVLNSDDTQLEVLVGESATQSGAIGETGGARPLAKIGGGTLALSGTNSYSGGTVVRGGTLSISADANLGLASGGVTTHEGSLLRATDSFATARTLTLDFVSNGFFFHAIEVAEDETLTWDGQITGFGALRKLGAGTLTLTDAANDYSGATLIHGGTVAVTSALALGRSTSTGLLLDGADATLRLLGDFDWDRALVVTGAGGTIDTNGFDARIAGALPNGSLFLGARLTKAGAGTLTLAPPTGNLAGGGGIYVTGGVLALANYEVGSIGEISIEPGTWLDLAQAGDGTFDNSVTGNGTLRKTGGGILTLAGSNTYGGGTVVADGTLVQGSGSALGFGDVTLSGGTLDLGAFDLLLDRIDGTSGVILSTGGGALTFAADESLVFDGSAFDIFAPIVVGASNTLTLLGNNSLLGGVTLSGHLILGASNAAGGAGNTITTTGSVITYADGIVNATPIVLASDDTQLEVLGTDVATQSGLIGESGGSRPLEKIGTGTLILTAGNGYSGGTALSAGTLTLGHDQAAGTGAITIAGGATLALDDDRTLANAIVSAGSGATPATIDAARAGVEIEVHLLGDLSGGDIAFVSSAFDPLLLGPVSSVVLTGANAHGKTRIGDGVLLQVGDGTDLSGGTTGSLGTGEVSVAEFGALAFDRSDATSVGNAITGAGTVLHTGTGTTTLTATNGYTGGTAIVAGTLRMGADGALGAGALAQLGGTLDLNGFDATFDDVVGLGGEIGNFAAGTQSVLTFDIGCLCAIYAGTIVDGAGTLALVKAGTGQLLLAGDNTYSGGTTLGDGTLVAGSDTAFGTGPFDHAGGTLLLDSGVALSLGAYTQSGGTLDLNGEEATVASLAGTGGTITNGGTLFVDGGTTSYGGRIEDGAGFTTLTLQNGADLTLSGANDFTGGLDVIDAALTLAHDDAAGGAFNTIYTAGDLAVIRFADGIVNASQIDLDALQTRFFVEAGASAEQLGEIFGCGCVGITKLGDGTLTLSGFNGYGGTTSILGGTLAITELGLGFSQLVEIGNGARLRALEDTFAGNVLILASGGTIDTGDNLLDVLGSVYFEGELTKTGSGTLLIEDISGDGDGDGGINVTEGTLALGGDFAAGTGTIELADGTTLQNFICGCETLELDNPIEVAIGGSATIDGNGSETILNGPITGGNVYFFGPLGTQIDPLASVFYLDGANSYGETRIGANVAVILEDGTLGTGNAVFEDVPSHPFFPASLVFLNTADYSFGGAIVGDGRVDVDTDPGVTITLTGSNTAAANFTGEVEVVSGRLAIDGDFGDVLGNTATLLLDGCGCDIPSLGGSGTFHGSVELGAATLEPGNSPGTLTIGGNLTLTPLTVLNYELGEPGVVGGPNNDLIVVNGDLTLDGTLNTAAFGPGYGPGYYRLFNYGGTLTDNLLDIGTIDGGLSAEVFTHISGQVNLRLGGPQIIQYWDGTDLGGTSAAVTGDGGSGIWNAADTNWTAPVGYAVNDAWQSQVGVFAGAAGGTVTVDGVQTFQELRFETDGYTLVPADGAARLGTTGGFSIIGVDPAITADIGVVIQGAAGLTKTGDGTLLLSALNAYTGATEVAAGTLRLGADNAINSASTLSISAGAAFDLDGLANSVAALSGAGDVTLGAGGELRFGGNGGSTAFGGAMSGEGAVYKQGTGTFTLSGDVSLTTGVSSLFEIVDGAIVVAAGAHLGADRVQNFGTLTNDGELEGITFNFGTLTNAGTMGQLSIVAGAAGNSGTIAGPVSNLASFTSTGIIDAFVDNFGTASLQGQLNGDLTNAASGATVTLSGTTTGIGLYEGAAGSVFDLAGFDTALGALTGAGSIVLGSATLTVGSAGTPDAFDGVISGAGGLIKVGTGTLTLGGANTYLGATQVQGGTLALGIDNAIGSASDLIVDAGGTFALMGFATQAASLSGSGFIILDSGQLDVGLDGSDTTFGGTLTGDGTFIKSGTGTLTVTGGLDVTPSGAGNMVRVDNGGLTVTSTGTLSGGVIDNFGVLDNSGAISGHVFNGGTLANAGTMETLTNTGTAVNSGTIAGNVLNFASFASTGIINGSLSNSATVLLQGELNGQLAGASAGATTTLTGTVTGIAEYLAVAGTTFDLAGFDTVLGGLNGDGSIVLGSATLTVDQDSPNSSTFAGTISGAGGLTKAGTGLLVLTGSNTYAGATRVEGGTLRMGAGGSLGLAADVDLAAGTTFDLDDTAQTIDELTGLGSVDLGSGVLTVGANDGTATFAGTIVGAGDLAKTGTGTFTVTGGNTYQGTTTITDGTLQVGDGGTTGTLGSGDIINNANLVFNRSDDVTVSQGIGGFGALTHDGAGTLVLTGDNTYSGGTTINGGTLRVGNGGTGGSLGTGDIANDGALVFDRSDDLIVAGVIDGIGTLTKLGDGTLTLSGANFYTGNTFILAGTLASAASGLGASQLVVIDNQAQLQAQADMFLGNLALLAGGGTIDTDSHDIEVLGDVTFTGLLTKTGTGSLILSDIFFGSSGNGGIDVLSGLLGLGSDTAAGTGLIRLGDGTILRNASCFCGPFELDNAIEIALGGTARIDGAGLDMILNGPIEGGNAHFVADTSGSAEIRSSIFTLNGLNSYGETTIGANVAVVLEDGTLGTGNVVFENAPSSPFTPAALVFANTADYDYGGAIVGDGLVIVATPDGATTVTLSGSNSPGANFLGTIDVTSGRLVIDGAVGDVLGNTATLLLDGCGCDMPSLGGSGTFHGSVALGFASLDPGDSPGTLTIGGDLALAPVSVLNYELGAPGAVGGPSNDRIVVGGDLTLDGTLNTIDFGPDYGAGYYRLFDYHGGLIDNQLDIGTVDGGLAAEVLTNIAGQVNLRLGGPQIIQYWDGTDFTGASAAVTGDGGAGIWNGSDTNWTAPAGYAINDSWQSQVGVFAGAVGDTVTVEGTQAFQELRFQTDGYTLLPADIFARLATTGGFSIVDVDPAITAYIGVQILGAGGLTKTGQGTLILATGNHYNGATDVAEGTLRAAANDVVPYASRLSVSAGATFDLDGLSNTVGSLSGAGAVTLGNGGLLTFGVDDTSTAFAGTISGRGSVAKYGTGTFTLSGDASLTTGGGSSFSVLNGAVNVTASGSIAADFAQNHATLDNAGTISALVLNHAAFTNSGMIASLTNSAGTATNSGTISGDVTNLATFTSTGIIGGALNNVGTALLEGQLNGPLGNATIGATATLTGTLTGVTSYQGFNDTLLDLAGFDFAVDRLGGGGTIQLGSATLTVGGADSDSGFGGTIAGGGALTKVGTGTLALASTNTYTGLTTVSAGRLNLGLAGSLAGDVRNEATFVNDGTVGGTLDNLATATNSGTLAGGVVNRGTFVTTGTIDSGATNELGGSFAAQGQINGFVVNSGTFDVTGALTGIGLFLQAATGQTNLAGFDLTVGALQGDGVVDLAAGNATLTTGDASSVSFLGEIGGHGNLVKVGTGQWTLESVHGFSGLTTVSEGTLALSSFASLVSAVQNDAMLLNDGIIAGLLTNNGNATNTGLLAGGVINNGTLVSTGQIAGGLVNSGTASIEGQLTSQVDNLAGAISLTGTTTGIGRVNQSAGATFELASYDTVFGSLAGNGIVALGEARLTVGGDHSSTSFAGVLFGTGNSGLTKLGAGTLSLTGVGLYGGPTLVDEGTLELAAGGSLAGDVVNDALFDNAGVVAGALRNTGTASNSGTIFLGVDNSGTFTSTGVVFTGLTNAFGAHVLAGGQIHGGVVNDGAFALTGGLTGITAFTQGVTGQLDLAGFDLTLGSLAGAGSIELGSGLLTVGASGTDTVFAGAINGSGGGLTKVGTGQLTLSGTNIRTGLTTIGAGTLTVTGSLADPVRNNATLLNHGTIFGPLTNDGTASNTGVLEGGVLNRGTFGSTGTVRGGFANTGSATFAGQLESDVDNLAGIITLTGTTTGIGRVDQSAGATFDLAGFDTAFGALAGDGTVVLGGATLSVGGDGSSTSFAGTFTGGGDSGLAKLGNGTFTLTGASSHTGLTTIAAGTLLLADGGTLGTGVVVNDATLAFDGALDTPFVNAVSGTGAIEKRGSHTLTLTGANSHGGGTAVLGGVLAIDNELALGTGLVALADGTTLRNAASFELLTLGNAIAIADGGTATIDGADFAQTALLGEISGGNLAFTSSGTIPALFVLGGHNTHGDTLIGPNTGVALADGTLGTGNVIFDPAAADPLTPAVLLFAHTSDYAYGGTIAGPGAIAISTAPGATITLSGSNTAALNYTGTVVVNGGTLAIDGAFGDVVGNTATLVLDDSGCGCSTAALGGSGTFHGNVEVISGSLAPGHSPGTLNIAGNLTLAADAILEYELGEAGTVGGSNNDLVIVGGDLTLDGTLNVTALPTFGNGYYRLFDYGGSLTDNGLGLGILPAGHTATVLTNIAGQVNVLFGDGAQLIQYWDGPDLTGGSAAFEGDGGTGTWTTADTNWTAPVGFAVNDAWQSQVGVFAGVAGGEVTIVGTQSFQELRFRTGGYVLAGATAADGLATSGGFSVIDVNAGIDAEIDATISGVAGLTKTGAGGLSLGGANSYTGLTTVAEGDLLVQAGGSLAGAVLNNASLGIDGSIAGLVTNNGNLLANGTLGGGLVNNLGATAYLNPGSMVTGAVTNAGRLDNLGTIAGDVANSGTFVSYAVVDGNLVNSGSALLTGQLNGAIGNLAGGGLTLTTVTGIGAVTQQAGASIVLAGGPVTIGSLAGAGQVVLAGGVLTTGGDDSSTAFAGTLSGDLGLTKTGSGTFTLSGTNTYAGATSVSDGTLALAATGSLASSLVFVGPGGALDNAGYIGGVVVNQGALQSTGILGNNLANHGTASLSGQLNGTLVNSGAIGLTGTLAGVGAVTQQASGAIDLNGFDITIGSLAGEGTVQLGGARLTTGGEGSDTGFAGAIAGSGGLTKAGAGTFTLTGGNTFTGLTAVDAGTLAIGATGSLAGDVRNDASFVNAGLVGGVLDNRGTASNDGEIAGGVINSGTLTTTGTIGTGLDNSGTVRAKGAIDGFVNNSGSFILTGEPTGITTFSQTASGSLDLADFRLVLGALTGAGSVALGTGELHLGAGDADMQFDGVVSGAGSLFKSGTGTLLLTGAHTFTGTTTVTDGALWLTGSLAGPVYNSATFRNEGTASGGLSNTAGGTALNLGTIAGEVLNFGSFASTGVIDGDLANSGTAFVRGTLAGALDNEAGTIAFTGATAGIGAVTQQAAATIDLAGFDTAFGSLAGDGAILLGSATLTVGGNGSDTAFAGVISGSGGLTKAGDGTLTLGGDHSYTGLTTVSGGTLALAAGGSLAGNVLNEAGFTNAGTVAGTLQNDGTASNSGTIHGAVANAGTLASTGTLAGGLDNSGTAGLQGTVGVGIVNSGTVALTGAIDPLAALSQTASGAFDLAGFDLSLGTLGGAGSIALGSGTLTVGAGNANSAFGGVLAGAGALVKAGTGTLIMTGAGNHTGGTTIAGGVLQLGDGGTGGSLVGPIDDRGVLAIDRSDAFTLSSAISGSGALVHLGNGATTLTGANSYTGGTRIDAGRLRGNSASLQGQIRIDAVLEFAQAANGTFAGQLLGAGRLEKTAGGRLVLAGDQSGFTGGTFVLGGELAVNGLLSRSLVTVGAGATLSGSGTVGGFVALDGAAVAPGNSIGTLGVNGNLAFQPGSTYTAEVHAAMGADLILSNGSALLDGTLEVVDLGGLYAFDTTFVLLHAEGGRTGEFADVAGLASFGHAYRPEIEYTDQRVLLRLAANRLSTLAAGLALTFNQRSTLERIDAAVEGGYSPQPLVALYNLSLAEFPAGLDALSGEAYATTTRVMLEDRLVREAVRARLVDLQTAEIDGAGWGIWGEAFRAWGRGDHDGNAADFDRDLEGFVVGIDRVSGDGERSLQLGVQGHYTTTDLAVDARGSRAEIERAGAGLHLGATAGAWALRTSVSYSKLSGEVDRAVAFTEFADRTHGELDGAMLQAFGELGYRHPLSAEATVEPFASVALTQLSFDGLTESGHAAALAVGREEGQLGLATFGLRGRGRFGGSGGARLSLDGSLGLTGAFGDRLTETLIGLAAAPQHKRPIRSARVDNLAAQIELDARLDLDERISLSVGYSGLIAEGAQDHAATAGLRVRF